MSTTPQHGQVPTTSSASPAAPNANLKRRRFLFALGAGTAATAAAATATHAIVAPIAQKAAAEAPTGKQGYRETDHVRDYYASTRL